MIDLNTPVVTQTLGISTVNSRWFAAYNPIPFVYQRIDAYVINVTPNATLPGIFQVDLFGTTFNIPTAVGGFIYLNSGSNNGVFLVQTALALTNGNTRLQCQGTIAGSSSGGFVNNLQRQNYRIVSTLTIFPGGGNVGITRTLTSGVDNVGKATVDFAPALREVLNSIADLDYTGVNSPNNNQFGFFQLAFQELYDSTTGQEGTVQSRFYFVAASLPYGSQYGCNMFNYMGLYGAATASQLDPDVFKLGKFLTKFAEPKYYVGWPFSLSFLYNEYWDGQEVVRAMDLLDINRQQIFGGTIETDLDTAGEEALNILTLDTSSQPGTKYVQVCIKFKGGPDELGGLQSNPLPVAPVRPVTGYNGTVTYNQATIQKTLINPYVNNYVQNYFFQYVITTYSLTVIECLTVKVLDCVDSPYMLMWLNQLGGYDYYMFEVNQIVSNDTGNLTQYQPYNPFIGDAERGAFDLQNEAQTAVSMGADGISKNDCIAIQDIRTSPVVYRVYQDGTQQRVIVEKGTVNVYETGLGTYNIELTVLEPETQIQLA